jgi:hypothetical protein
LTVPASAIGQSVSVPGVTEVAPGVRVIDGSKVEVLAVSGTELTAAIKGDPRFSSIKKWLGTEGITNPGPSGSITHMYRLRDTDDDTDKVLILFVRGGKVVDHLIN